MPVGVLPGAANGRRESEARDKCRHLRVRPLGGAGGGAQRKAGQWAGRAATN